MATTSLDNSHLLPETVLARCEEAYITWTYYLEMDHLKINTDRTLARRIKQVTMSFNTKTSKYTFQNGHYVGQHCKKSKLFMAVTFKGGSVYHTVEELIVIAQGCYQVSTYKLVMTERHFNSSHINTFDSLKLSSIPGRESFVPNRSGRGNWSKSA